MWEFYRNGSRLVVKETKLLLALLNNAQNSSWPSMSLWTKDRGKSDGIKTEWGINVISSLPVIYKESLGYLNYPKMVAESAVTSNLALNKDFFNKK